MFPRMLSHSWVQATIAPQLPTVRTTHTFLRLASDVFLIKPKGPGLRKEPKKNGDAHIDHVSLFFLCVFTGIQRQPVLETKTKV